MLEVASEDAGPILTNGKGTMPITDQLIDDCVDRYFREYDRYLKFTEVVARACQKIVRDNSIRASVSWRAKDIWSFQDKLRRWQAKPDKAHLSTEQMIFSEMKDISGVRISTYVESDQEDVIVFLKKRFFGADRKEIEPILPDGASAHYRAKHCCVMLHEEEIDESTENIADLVCEIQVTSLLAHVWNEVEHDLIYKPQLGNPSQSEARLLSQLADITRAGDSAIVELFARIEERNLEENADFQNSFDFASRLKDELRCTDKFNVNSGELFEAFRKLNLRSPRQIRDFLELANPATFARANSVFDEFESYLDRHGHQFNLSKTSSDLMLMLLLDRNAARVEISFPAGRGKGRPARIRRLATKFVEMRTPAAIGGAGPAAPE